MRHIGQLCFSCVASSPHGAFDADELTQMPYLHWDTAWRYRKYWDSMIAVDRMHEKQLVEQASAERNRRRVRSGAREASVPGDTGKYPESIARLRNSRRRLVVFRPLGQCLLDAAALAEAMTIHRDQKLLKQYLHSDDKRYRLHPRRGLHQLGANASYTPRSACSEQVVYQATAPDEQLCRKMHKDPDDGPTPCTEDIKIPRVLMVDQLWLWVLDDRTVLSCFPPRFGETSVSDPTDVYRSILQKLRARQEVIDSSYDIARVVVEECSGFFFGSEISDKRPRLLSVFSEAIDVGVGF